MYEQDFEAGRVKQSSTIEVVIENLEASIQVERGTALSQLAEQYYNSLPEDSRHPILGALVNNVVCSLEYKLYNPKTIRFFDYTHRQGYRVYQNSLCLMLSKAVHDCYPHAQLFIDHSIPYGFYCRIEGALSDEGRPLPSVDVAQAVSARMKILQELNLPFECRTVLLKDALEIVQQLDMPETVRLLKGLHCLYIDLQFLGNTVHYTSSSLAPTTGCLSQWDFYPYEEGFALSFATLAGEENAKNDRTSKLFQIFQEHHRWADLMHVPTIVDYNEMVRNHQENQLIQVAEALHEKKYAEIAEQVNQRRDDVRMILLAGPSSSGKTTSCRRLAVQLSVLGFDVKQISLDDYFVDRSRTPRLPNGEFDFESVDALDIPLLNDHLQRLFQGEEVQIPTFDFLKGDPYFSGKTLQLASNSILLVEGIHALNPKLTAQIDESKKFKVYVSALTQIAIDSQNVIRSSDNRLIRRMVRDNNFRGWDAFNTLHRWGEVQRGEYLHIFPYQEEADVMFNSALLYELGVLKVFAEPLLKRVPQDCEEYAEARRLLDFIELIEPIDAKFIPPTSIMREFLGGSSFDY